MPMDDSAIHARSVALLQQLTPHTGYTQTQLDGVTLMRANAPMAHTPALYEPSIVIVVQGRKRGFHGGQVYVYDAQHYLVLSVPLPFSIETEASAEQPLLGVVLRIDPAATAQLALELHDTPNALPPQAAAMYASHMDGTLQAATLRLLQALACPTEARVLGPAIVREITYRVLTSAQGTSLRAALLPSSHFGRIARVIAHIHRHYEQALPIEALAELANLSPPAFHVHFKAITHASPLQYVKATRLHQARLLMVRQGLSASAASHQVGYESPTQFSREFKRFFGRTPVQEMHSMQALLDLHPAVVQV